MVTTKKIDIVPYPNFSIILPGGCNGNCEFCTWDATKTCEGYLKRVDEVVKSLPDYFVSVSITGGEPTLSPYFWQVLEIVNKRKWDRIVLTTNGSTLNHSAIDALKGKVTFINISRHHYDDVINESIFRSHALPTTKELKDICNYSFEQGMPVTLNCVVSRLEATKKEVEKYVGFAKRVGAKGVHFRKVQTATSTVAVFPHERLYLDDPTYVNHPCPVCRTSESVIKGMHVGWKAAVLEPSHEIGYWFEAILHPSGTLSGDWSEKMAGEARQLNHLPDTREHEMNRDDLKKIIRETIVEIALSEAVQDRIVEKILTEAKKPATKKRIPAGSEGRCLEGRADSPPAKKAVKKQAVKAPVKKKAKRPGNRTRWNNSGGSCGVGMGGC